MCSSNYGNTEVRETKILVVAFYLFCRIGVAEKGAVTLDIKVEDIPSGHSSMPGKESNIGILAKALYRWK